MIYTFIFVKGKNLPTAGNMKRNGFIVVSIIGYRLEMIVKEYCSLHFNSIHTVFWEVRVYI